MARAILKGIGRSLLVCFVLMAVYALWSLWAYRDIPVTALIDRYGGDNLHRVNVDGVTLYYRLDGRELGRAPALLLIHSHYFNSRMWDPWVAELKNDFTLIRFDMTSHGLTGADSRGNYSMDRDLYLIEQLLNMIGVESLAIAGSSLGGNMAFHYAARHPEQVSHLVLINSGGLKREQSSRRNAAAIPDWFHRAFYFVPEVAYRAFIEWMVIDDSVVTDALVEQFHAMFRREGNRQAEMARMRSFDVGNPGPVLAKVSAPTLILWGGDNPQLPISHVERFTQALENAVQVSSRIYPGVGHLLPVELPAVSARDTRQFILDGSLSDAGL